MDSKFRVVSFVLIFVLAVNLRRCSGYWTSRRGYLAQDDTRGARMWTSTHETVRRRMGRQDCENWCATVRDCMGMSWSPTFGCKWWRTVDWDLLDQRREGQWISAEYVARREEVCYLPSVLSEPTCYNPQKLWTYDYVRGTCSQVMYRGCFGSKNLFNTKEECEDLCQGAY